LAQGNNPVPLQEFWRFGFFVATSVFACFRFSQQKFVA